MKKKPLTFKAFPPGLKMVHTFSRFWASPGNPWCSVWVCGVHCAVYGCVRYCQYFPFASSTFVQCCWICPKLSMPATGTTFLIYLNQNEIVQWAFYHLHIFSVWNIFPEHEAGDSCAGDSGAGLMVSFIWITRRGSNESKRKMRIEEVCTYWLLSNLLETGTTTSQTLFQFHVVQVKCHNMINATSSIHITQTSSKEIKGWTLGWIDKRRTN